MWSRAPCKPHGGLLFYRGFVYDHHMDWNNPKNDRARAAYDNFQPLDGKFDDNVIVQIKHGPIDFQVREPASPLFGALEKTNQAIELQITQEYFGQARHTVFLVPMWKEALDFDMHVRDGATPVKALVAGKIFHRPTGGFVGVSNVGLDENWYGNHMSQANLYGFGRLAWNPDLSAQRIIDEWTRLTFGSDPKAVETINAIQLNSWRTFENYTGPLGLQTLTDIVGNHYGVAVEASERNGWGQWHRADEKGVGMDRTVATGTGYIGQYRPAGGQSVRIAGDLPGRSAALHAPRAVHPQAALRQDGDPVHLRFALRRRGGGRRVGARLEVAARPHRRPALPRGPGATGIPGGAHRSLARRRERLVPPHLRHRRREESRGQHPGRTEAEAMKLDGYTVRDITPWETASGGKAITCPQAKCTAALRYEGAPGWYTLHVQYFDLNGAVSRFQLWVGTQLVDEWTASDHLPARKLDSSSSTRRVISGIALRPGDEIRIEGFPKAANWQPWIIWRFCPSPRSPRSGRRTEIVAYCPPLTRFVIDVYSLVAKLSASDRSLK